MGRQQVDKESRGTDLKILLKPREFATHHRDQATHPPQVSYLPGTRLDVKKAITKWLESSELSWKSHVCWVYGQAGCGKSTIAQEVAEALEKKKKLLGSYFWARSRSSRRLAPTLAWQFATYIPKAAPYIEAALAEEPNLADSDISLRVQLEKLILGPCRVVFKKHTHSLLGVSKQPWVFVLDGIDESPDTNSMIDMLDCIVNFFRESPALPIRFLITGRVEERLSLRASRDEIHRINLDHFPSTQDVSNFINTSFSVRRAALVTAGTPPADWPSAEAIDGLTKLSNGSFSTAAPLVRYILPQHRNSEDPTFLNPPPLDRDGFDQFCKHILEPAKNTPYFMAILSALALLNTPLSVYTLSRFIGANSYVIMTVLSKICAIVDVPSTDDLPVSLVADVQEFLLEETRSQSFHAKPAVLRLAAFNLLDRALSHYEALSEDQWMGRLQKSVHHAVTSWPKHFDLIMEADKQFFMPGFDERWMKIFSRIDFLPHFSDLMALLVVRREPVQVLHICTILEADTADLTLIFYGLVPLLVRQSRAHWPTVTIEDWISFRHKAIIDFLLDPARARHLLVQPANFTYVAQRFMAIAFGLPRSPLANDKTIFMDWAKMLTLAVANDPMFEREYVEGEFDPVKDDQKREALQGWREAMYVTLSPVEIGILQSKVDGAIGAIERQFPDILSSAEETFTRVREGSGKNSLGLASRFPVSIVDILLGFRMLIEHQGEVARLCLQRGCGTGLQIERHLQISGNNRFVMSLYHTKAKGTSRPLTRGQSMMNMQGEEALSPFADPPTPNETHPGSDLDEIAPVVKFSSTRNSRSLANLQPIASSSKLPSESAPLPTSPQMPQPYHANFGSPRSPKDSVLASTTLPDELLPLASPREPVESESLPVRSRSPADGILKDPSSLTPVSPDTPSSPQPNAQVANPFEATEDSALALGKASSHASSPELPQRGLRKSESIGSSSSSVHDDAEAELQTFLPPANSPSPQLHQLQVHSSDLSADQAVQASPPTIFDKTPPNNA